MKDRIVGREAELALLNKLYQSDTSEFVAIYGRRRVGKTFLVRECFEKELVFSVSGLANCSQRQQLENFRNALLRCVVCQVPVFQNWQDAFEALIGYLNKLRRKGKKVVFLDELPWLDTLRSNFISALEGFWNGWACGRHDILLIVCGSATSWMMDKLIKNHGGLHNRLTRQIYLQPFTLKETKSFLTRRGLMLSLYELAICYMIFGGIPYYLNLLDVSLSLAQNVDRLLFSLSGELHQEFDNLYAALFRNSQEYIKVVSILGAHVGGVPRAELLKSLGKASGSGISTVLANLEHCGFIRQYSILGTGRKQKMYQLMDFFTLFYFHFLKKMPQVNANFWQSMQGTPRFYAWAGLTFELLCLHHVEQIKRALGIQGILSYEYAYRSPATRETPAQIDLVIDRKDNTISVCEAKFTEGNYFLSATEELKLQNRMQVFRRDCARHKSLQLVLLTTFGLGADKHRGIFQQEVTLEDLVQ